MKYRPDCCLKLSSLFWLKVLLQMLLMNHHCHCQLVSTIPSPAGPAPFMVYVSATLNAEASVTCTNLIAGTPPVWQLVETKEYLTFVNNTAVNHSYIQVSNPFNTPSTVKLTITNFTRDLNVFSVVCRPDKTSNDSDSATILIGLSALPILSQVSVYNVTENETAEISIVTNDPFPPHYSLIWMCDNQVIQNSMQVDCPKCGIVEVNLTGSITLHSVLISCTETTFWVTVPGPPPQQQTQFTLNVHYAPSAQLTGISQIFASVNDNVTLRVINGSIDGNPKPTVSWRFNTPDGPFIAASGRYSMESDGLLSISSVTEDDFGEYYFTASNNVGENITAIISLLEIEPRIKSVGYVSQNGGITLNFSLASTGYENNYNQVSVNASCSKDTGEPDHDIVPHPADLSYACAEQCINSNLMGTGSIVGTVAAGIVYQCSVTVSTSNGSNTFTIDSITPTTGRPSKPIIKWITSDESDTVTIYLRSIYAGIDSADERSSLTFRVVIQSGNGRVTIYNETHPVNQYRSNSTVSLSQRISENGDYVIHVTAINQYGFSDTVMESITISRPPPTSPPRTSPSPLPSPYESATPPPPESSSGSSGLPVMAIVGILIGAFAIIVGVIGVVVLIIVIMKRKGKKENSTKDRHETQGNDYVEPNNFTIN